MPLGDGLYYNSLTHQICAEEDLGSRLMLAGQERQAVLDRIFDRGPFEVTLVPSFECNLRCPQCYVGHLLTKPSGNRIGNTDPERLIAFVRRAVEHLGPLQMLGMVGGEPFLHDEAFRRYLDAGFPMGSTTNGIFDFGRVKDIIGRLKSLTFSVDGWPEQHNRTRRSLNRAVDPFVTTYRNICLTIESFPDLDVRVQGTVIDEDVVHPEQVARYFALMLGAGVAPDKISIGPCAATVNRKPISAYLAAVATGIRTMPCCDHSLHKGFVVHGDSVYGSYHRLEEFAPIGTLDDAIEQIVSRRKERVLETMPMLQDDVCMNECKAVGVCWGLCTSARHVFVDGKPSSVCDRAHKEAKLVQMAKHPSKRECKSSGP